MTKTTFTIHPDMSESELAQAFYDLQEIAEDRGWLLRGFSPDELEGRDPDGVWNAMFDAFCNYEDEGSEQWAEEHADDEEGGKLK